MKALIVRMPAASARDALAISVELSGRSQEMADADLVIGVWGSDGGAYVMKDRHQLMGEGAINVVNARSVEAIERELANPNGTCLACQSPLRNDGHCPVCESKIAAGL